MNQLPKPIQLRIWVSISADFANNGKERLKKSIREGRVRKGLFPKRLCCSDYWMPLHRLRHKYLENAKNQNVTNKQPP